METMKYASATSVCLSVATASSSKPKGVRSGNPKKKAWKVHVTGATLEVDSSEKKALLSAFEKEATQRRKDGSLFLVYCSNCLDCGHSSVRCPARFRIAVIGDSHCSIWAVSSHFYQNTAMARMRMAGLSAVGLMRGDSQKQSHRKSVAMVRNCHAAEGAQWLFIVAGKVDLDYVYYFRQLRAIRTALEKTQKNTHLSDSSLLTDAIQSENETSGTHTIEEEESDSLEKCSSSVFSSDCTKQSASDCFFSADSFYSIDDLINESTDTLVSFAEELVIDSGLSPDRVLTHAAHLPPVADGLFRTVLIRHFVERSGMQPDFVSKYLTVASLKQRSKHVLKFNETLRRKLDAASQRYARLHSLATDSTEHRFGFVDITSHTLDTETGTVKRQFVKDCASDIHLNADTLFPLFHKHFRDDLNLSFAADMDATAFNYREFCEQINERFS